MHTDLHGEDRFRLPSPSAGSRSRGRGSNGWRNHHDRTVRRELVICAARMHGRGLDAICPISVASRPWHKVATMTCAARSTNGMARRWRGRLDPYQEQFAQRVSVPRTRAPTTGQGIVSRGGTLSGRSLFESTRRGNRRAGRTPAKSGNGCRRPHQEITENGATSPISPPCTG